MVEGKFSSSEQQTAENRNGTINNPNGCFQNRLGVICQGTTMRGTWSYQERTKHINVLELLPILTFTKRKSVASLHLQIENMTALPALLGKNGGNSQSRTVTNS